MRLVPVLGMHRSGTSAVTGLLGLLGAHLGEDELLLGVSPSENAKGFFEYVPVLELNERCLSALGGSWDAPPEAPEHWESGSDLIDLREEAARIVQRLDEGADGRPVVFKDPRTCLTLPLWRQVADVDAVVICLRHPDAVAASLRRRNGLGEDAAARLWLRYTGAAFAVSADVASRIVIVYEQLIDDAEATCGQLVDALALPRPDADAERRVQDFVDASLSHHTRREPPTPSLALRLARSAYRLLADGEDPHALLPLLGAGTADGMPGVLTAIQAADQLPRVSAELEDERARTEREQARREQVTGDLAASRALVERHEERAQELRVELQAAYEQLQASGQELERLASRRAVRAAVGLSSAVRAPFRSLPRALRRLRGRRAMSLARGASGRTVVRSGVRDDHVVGPSTVSALESLGAVTVVVPVYNAAGHLARCVAAVRRNTRRPYRLVLVDDASPDPEIAELLTEFGRSEDVTVLRNDTNLGFSATVNRGIATCDTDVVVLNSDAEVGPRWLTQLAVACYTDEDIGTVTAISDKAGAFSVPIPNGDAPHHLSRDDVARWIGRTSHRLRPWTPTANGFCMYLRRAMLDEVGVLDADAFPRGYGEENDLCMRAAASGWRHVVDDATLVYHAESASFGHGERERLTAAGLEIVHRRWPEYHQLAQRFVGSEALAAVRRVVGDACEQIPTHVPTRLLTVLHDGNGGTPAACQDIMDATAPSYEGLVLKSDGSVLTLHRHFVDAPPLERHALAEPVGFGAEGHEEYELVVTDWMVRYGIEMVHVHHLIKHPLSLLRIAAAIHVPVVLSVHDFYLVCPTVHLLDERDRYCGGVCTEGPGRCEVDWADPRTLPQLKHDWVHVWRDRVRAVLPLVDAFVTMNPTTWDVLTTAYPELATRRMELIEHGRDLEPRAMAGGPPSPGEALRVLVPGSTGVHKGARLVAEVAARDGGRRIEFHFLGKIDPRFAHAGISHGRYRREEFTDRVAAIEPHVIGLFSIWPETYAYTLTEAWSTGIPVVVSNLGALGDRVARHGGGWVTDVSNADRVLAALIAIADDPDGYREAVASVSLSGVRGLAAMGADYAGLYESLWEADVPSAADELVTTAESL